MLKPLATAAAAAAVLALVACDDLPKAPTDARVCFQVATKRDGEI